VRLVLDTSVIVSAFRSKHGASRKLMEAFDANMFVMLLSIPLFLEYEDVLTRPEQMAVHGVALADISDFLNTLAARALEVTFHYRIRPQLPDPNDEMVLETAVNGVADAIVTHNTSDFLAGAARFGKQVLTPGHIIKQRLQL
jgi:putative PIN family toxin of toxin-antitoxin system